MPLSTSLLETVLTFQKPHDFSGELITTRGKTHTNFFLQRSLHECLSFLPKGRKIVASKWVHTYKGDEKGYCVKTKSRLVAKGFSQVAGVDHNETTTPTPAAAPVKMIAAVANEKGLPVYHLDVSQAFVQVPLKEEIFMRLPAGCGELSGKIVRLLKCQYGLKQVGREWHMLLVNWLVEENGLEQCKAEPCVFRLMVKDEMVVVHVDDI